MNAFFLVLMLTVITLTVSCAGAPTPDDVGEDGTVLNYRIADKAEGIELMLSNDEFFAGMTQNDLDFRMQESGAQMDRYKEFAKEQVRDFTDEQKAIIDEHMERISSAKS